MDTALIPFLSSVSPPSSVQFSSSGSSGGHEGRFSEDSLAVFSVGGPCEQFRHGQGCPIFGFVHPAFILPTTASPTLHGATKEGFGEAVMARDLPEPCNPFQVFKTMPTGGKGGCGRGRGKGGAYDSPMSQQFDGAIVRQPTVRRGCTPTSLYFDASI